MIKLQNTRVEGWEAALRGMRNPLNSWDKSDTRWLHNGCEDVCPVEDVPFILGDKDEALMRKLVKAGSDHRKFIRMITVTLDITAPWYWWKEFDTYKIGTVADSCSTMHTIADKPFTRSDFSHEHLVSMNLLDFTIENLNYWRDKFNVSQRKDKEAWWNMIQQVPSSYNQKRTVLLNYEVLRNIYHARRNHKLDEWREFCEWIENLPCYFLITDREVA